MTRSTPYLAVDTRVLRRNIASMAEFAAGAGVALRPHAKTHKSLDVARLQLEAGAVGLSVATLGEAEVFAGGGFDDLFIAYPLWVDEAKGRRLRTLVRRARVVVGVATESGARALGSALGDDAGLLGVRIEVDSGHHRSGTVPEEAGRIAAAASEAGLRIDGVFTFPGHGYGPGRALQAATDEARALGAAAASLAVAGIECPVVSGGSTPTARRHMPGAVNELRPGVYVYNDAQQIESGTCTEESVALTVAATVVDVRGHLVVVDAGSKVLGADRPDWTTGYGRVAGHPAARVVALSEHHATIDWPATDTAVPPPGAALSLIPNHVCNAVNLVDDVLAVDNGYDAVWAIHARGRNS